MTVTAGACPTCGGERLVDRLADLRHAHDVACPLRAREDSTTVADFDRARRLGVRAFRRTTTATEVALLAACGVVVAPASDVAVVVDGPGLRRRVWPGVDLGPAVSA